MTRPVGIGSAPTCYRHADRETYVSCVRCGRPICPDCMRPASVGFQCPDEETAPKVRTVRPGGAGLAAVARAAPVTASLVAANVAVFVVFVATGSQLVGSGIGDAEARWVQQSVVVANGDYYRILTAMFTHFGLLHVGSNMLVLFFIGVPLERQLGPRRYAAIYLVSGIGGGVATYLFVNPLQVSAGASGAIFGLLGAYFVVSRRMPTAQLGSVGGTILFNLIITFTVPGISITDHLGGLAVGALLGAVVGLDRQILAGRRIRTGSLGIEVAAFATVLVLLVGVAAVRTHVLRDRYHLRSAAAPVTAVTAVAAPPAPLPPPRA